jgi:hypothetical protein
MSNVENLDGAREAADDNMTDTLDAGLVRLHARKHTPAPVHSHLHTRPCTHARGHTHTHRCTQQKYGIVIVFPGQ